MSIRVEWMEARHVSGEILQPDGAAPDGQYTDKANIGLMFGADDCTVIEGTREELREMLARLTRLLDDEPAPIEGPTFRFYLGGHLTFITDAEGTVVALEVCPYQEHPVIDDYQEDDAEGVDLEGIRNKAAGNCWDFPALQHLPAGITWEV